MGDGFRGLGEVDVGMRVVRVARVAGDLDGRCSAWEGWERSFCDLEI